MLRAARLASWVIGIAVSAAGPSAHGQSNLDAGKSPAQIFSDTCSACHRSPRELKRTSPAFMREHYTTGIREAVAMAAYLASVGSDPRAVQQRRPPAIGAGQAAVSDTAPVRPPVPVPAGTDHVKPETQAGLPAQAPAHRTAVTTEQAKPAPAAAAKARRPSESVEAGMPWAHAGSGPEAASPQTAAMPAAKPNPSAEYQE